MTFSINHNLDHHRQISTKQVLHIYMQNVTKCLHSPCISFFVRKIFFYEEVAKDYIWTRVLLEPVQKKLDHSPKKNKPFKSHAIAKWIKTLMYIWSWAGVIITFKLKYQKLACLNS